MSQSVQIHSTEAQIALLGPFSEVTVDPGLKNESNVAVAPRSAIAEQGCHTEISGNNVIVRNPSPVTKTAVIVRISRIHSDEIKAVDNVVALAGPGTVVGTALADLVQGSEVIPTSAVAAITEAEATVGITPAAGQNGLFDAGIISEAADVLSFDYPGTYIVTWKATIGDDTVDTFTAKLRRNPGTPVVADTQSLKSSAAVAWIQQIVLQQQFTISAADVTGGVNNKMDLRTLKGGGEGNSGALSAGTMRIDKVA